MHGSGEPIREITAESPLDVSQSGGRVHLTLLNLPKILARLTAAVDPFTDFKGVVRKAYRWRKVRPLSGGSYTNTDDLVEGLNAADEPPTWPAFCADPNATIVADPSAGNVVWLYPGARDDRTDVEENYGLEWNFWPSETSGNPNCLCPGIYTQCSPLNFIPKKLVGRFHSASPSSLKCLERQFYVNHFINLGSDWWNGGGADGSPSRCGDLVGSGGAYAIELFCDATVNPPVLKLRSDRHAYLVFPFPGTQTVVFGHGFSTVTPTFDPFFIEETYNVDYSIGGTGTIGTIKFTLTEEMGTGAGGFPPGQVVVSNPEGASGTSTLSTTRTRVSADDNLTLQFQIGSNRWLENQMGSY